MLERQYDDLLPVCLYRDKKAERYIMVDRHNDLIATFDEGRDDRECQRIIDAVNAQATIADLQGKVEAAEKERDEQGQLKARLNRDYNLLQNEYLKLNEKVKQEAAYSKQVEIERDALQQRVAQLEDWRDQVTIALQRPGGARFEDVPQHVRDLVADHATLLGLVQAANYELAALFPMPDNPTFENAFAVCGNKNTADARCILNTYEAIHEAASLPAQGGVK